MPVAIKRLKVNPKHTQIKAIIPIVNNQLSPKINSNINKKPKSIIILLHSPFLPLYDKNIQILDMDHP